MFKKLFAKKNSAEIDEIRQERLDSLREKGVAGNEMSLVIPQFEDLDDYQFLKLVFVGPLNVKTMDGGEVKFITADQSLSVDADNYEIATEFSKKLGIGVTEIDLTLDEALRDVINNMVLSQIEVKIKKSTFLLDVYNQGLLKETIDAVIPDFEVEYEEIRGFNEEEE